MDDYFIRLLETMHIELTTRTVLNSVLCGAIAGIDFYFECIFYQICVNLLLYLFRNRF